MATYAKATYNAAKYACNRPTYPRQLFDSVFHFHGQGSRSRWDTVVDLGCGPGECLGPHGRDACSVLIICSTLGQATTELTPFCRVIGVDPSPRMIEQAKQSVSVGLANQVQYVQSPAESMPFLPDGSVDMIISGLC